ncbi:MAG: bifunctional 3-deoxy-7-phosphoheptulonate synthase/chorismate mutase type II [Bacteroidales bacterium]|nr:bifunctional 3-deoxy-7-phosphoheptulonate synthase/chorismate mutase type II [Bacteroidales bacterium]
MKDLKPIIDDVTGCRRPIIIAGPCSAESLEQVMTTAKGLKEAGIDIFRAGIWKPRTRPGGFEGVGVVGLPWLKRVHEETGMRVATEIANRGHAQAALEAGIDILWIGARTSANPFAMQEIADAIAESGLAEKLTVLVKNPVNPDLELWIGALQRIYNAGVRRLGGIHRGFTAYGKHAYRNQPQWHIPFELARRYPSLPILCDPSHIGGHRELISPLCQQAMDMGYEGLIIESHCNPDEAWSDAAQQVTPEMLAVILDGLTIRDVRQTTESLGMMRREIDRLDNELIEVLNRRMAICRDIGRYKMEHRMPIVQTGRYDDILNSRARAGQEMGMSPEFMRSVFSSVHEESVRQQIEVHKKGITDGNGCAL